jgi:hypothetical protein
MTSFSYASRDARIENEPLTARREEGSYWHARDENGNLIATDKYQNDLKPRLKRAGFDVTFEQP